MNGEYGSMNGEWEINADLQWEVDRNEIRFVVTKGVEHYGCAITQTALTDYFVAEDTKEAAFSLFEDYKEQILTLAVGLIEWNLKRDDDIYAINSQRLKVCWS